MAHDLNPDVVLLDLHMPELGGMMLLERLRAELPAARTIVMTASEKGEPLLDAVAAGASGYLTKRASGEVRSKLTATEHEVLRLVAQGLTDKQIAEKIYVSPRTVQNHLARIRDKTDLRRRSELARWAVLHAVY